MALFGIWCGCYLHEGGMNKPTYLLAASVPSEVEVDRKTIAAKTGC